MVARLKKVKNGIIDRAIVDELRTVHRSLRKAASSGNRGHRDQNVTMKKSAAPARGVPQLADLTLIGAEENLTDDDGVSLQKFDVDQLNRNSVGYCVASQNKAGIAMSDHMHPDICDRFSGVCVMLVKKAAMNAFSKEQQRAVDERFVTTYFDGEWLDEKARCTHTITCAMLQFGGPQATWNEREHLTVEVKTEAAQYVLMSAQYANLANTKDFSTAGKNNFAREVATAAGPNIFHNETKPVYTRTRGNLTFKGESVGCHEGKVYVTPA